MSYKEGVCKTNGLTSDQTYSFQKAHDDKVVVYHGKWKILIDDLISQKVTSTLVNNSVSFYR